MTVRTWVASRLIRLARRLDPVSIVDWTWIRKQEGLPKSIPVLSEHDRPHPDESGYEIVHQGRTINHGCVDINQYRRINESR